MKTATTKPAYDVDALRRTEFPWALRRVIYLNSASVGPYPERTRRALEAFNARRCQPEQLPDEELSEIEGRTRRLCARLIGADSAEIALGFNTSFGVNLAATALGLKPGDRIVLLDGDFPANVYPWLNLERRGLDVEFIRRDARGLPNEEGALERLERGDVRLFATSAVGFCTGYRLDLGAISRVCRSHGTYLVIDGIQALGVLPLDVRQVPVDILACGGQKWLLGPWGTGFAYIRRGLIDELDPVTVGWLGFKSSLDFHSLLSYNLDPLEGARRFELGTLGSGDFDALNNSLSLLLELGICDIFAHVRAVQKPLVDWIGARSDVEWVSDPAPERRSGIIAFRTAAPAELCTRLQEAGIKVALREGAVRVSTHAYNTAEEIEQLIGVAEKVLEG